VPVPKPKLAVMGDWNDMDDDLDEDEPWQYGDENRYAFK